MKYIENAKEIAFESREDALAVASKLLDAGYVVMISREEKLTIVNYNWASPFANRNDFVFISKDSYFMNEEINKSCQ